MHLQSRGVGGSGDRARYERAYREQAERAGAHRDAGARAPAASAAASSSSAGRPIRAATCWSRRCATCRTISPGSTICAGSGGGDNAYRIRELQGMMNARGCDLPGGSLFEASPRRQFALRADEPVLFGRRHFRTLCVRTCDGYYFPISFSTTSDRFPEDAQTCEAMCPGAEARLFYHPNPGGGPENMTSITGEAYSSLPTAFQYRTSLNPSCTCKPAGGYTIGERRRSGRRHGIPSTRRRPLPQAAAGARRGSRDARRPRRLFRAAASARRGCGSRHAGRDPAQTVGRSASSDPRLASAEQDALVLTPVPN